MGNVDELIQAQVLAARAACEQTTSNALKLLIDSVDRGLLPAVKAWVGAEGRRTRGDLPPPGRCCGSSRRQPPCGH